MSIRLVTGGCGFLGTHLVRALGRAGHAVRVLDPSPPGRAVPGVEYVRGSVTEEEDVRRAIRDVGVVHHVAGRAGLWSADRETFERVNHRGTRTVLEAARRAGVERFVHTSTEVILRDFGQGGPLAPGEPPPLAWLEHMPGPYPRSKLKAERAVFEAAADGLPATVVSPTVPIGPGDRNLTPPGRMMLGFLNGKHPAYLETVLDLIDVRDLAEGHRRAGERGEPGVRYLLGGRRVGLGELLERLEELTGLGTPGLRVPYPVALLASHLAELRASWLRGGPPAATRTGVRLARAPHQGGGRPASALGVSLRPLRETLLDALRWFESEGLLQRTPARRPWSRSERRTNR